MTNSRDKIWLVLTVHRGIPFGMQAFPSLVSASAYAEGQRESANLDEDEVSVFEVDPHALDVRDVLTVD